VSDVDFDEVVTLLALRGRASAGYERGGALPPMTLARAVHTVMVDWVDDPIRRMSASILREEGRPILTLTQIEKLYQRPDFPDRSEESRKGT
jgi:hypothetical protein